MRRETSQTDLGVIKIHKNVISSITSLAATEIDGVKRIGGDFKSGLLELIGKKTSVAIKVDFDKNGDASVSVPIVIKYGFNIPDVAGRAQENIRAALEKMTALSIKDININVQGIEK